METLVTAVLRKSRASAAVVKAAQSNASLSSLPTADSSGVTYLSLLKLLSCLQTSFLAWIKSILAARQQNIIKTVSSLLLACMYPLTLFHCAFYDVWSVYWDPSSHSVKIYFTISRALWLSYSHIVLSVILFTAIQPILVFLDHFLSDLIFSDL